MSSRRSCFAELFLLPGCDLFDIGSGIGCLATRVPAVYFHLTEARASSKRKHTAQACVLLCSQLESGKDYEEQGFQSRCVPVDATCGSIRRTSVRSATERLCGRDGPGLRTGGG